jgi:hypothetical protein
MQDSVNYLLVELVDSVLGAGSNTSKGNRAYCCPFCKETNSLKKKLEINFTKNIENTNKWGCWVCNSRGKKITTLFKQLNVHKSKLEELRSITKDKNITINATVDSSQIISLPLNYKPLFNDSSLLGKKAINYLKNRNITLDDIKKYNIGYCDYGEYQNCIIIPSYDKNGELNYFTARNFDKNSFRKYKNPTISRDIIPFEFYINWKYPIILCEGFFDAITIKRNAIPLLGKTVSNKLMKRLSKNDIRQIYIVLDKDALKQTLQLGEYFLNQGKEIYIIKMTDKDPNDMGYSKFHENLMNVNPLRLTDLMLYKLEH